MGLRLNSLQSQKEKKKTENWAQTSFPVPLRQKLAPIKEMKLAGGGAGGREDPSILLQRNCFRYNQVIFLH